MRRHHQSRSEARQVGHEAPSGTASSAPARSARQRRAQTRLSSGTSPLERGAGGLRPEAELFALARATRWSAVWCGALFVLICCHFPPRGIREFKRFCGLRCAFAAPSLRLRGTLPGPVHLINSRLYQWTLRLAACAWKGLSVPPLRIDGRTVWCLHQLTRAQKT